MIDKYPQDIIDAARALYVALNVYETGASENICSADMQKIAEALIAERQNAYGNGFSDGRTLNRPIP